MAETCCLGRVARGLFRASKLAQGAGNQSMQSAFGIGVSGIEFGDELGQSLFAFAILRQ